MTCPCGGAKVDAIFIIIIIIKVVREESRFVVGARFSIRSPLAAPGKRKLEIGLYFKI